MNQESEHKFAPFPSFVGFFGFVGYPVFFKKYQQCYYDIQEGYRSEELRAEFNELLKHHSYGRALSIFVLPTFLAIVACTFVAAFLKLCGLLILWLFLRWLYDFTAEAYWGYVFSMMNALFLFVLPLGVLSCLSTLFFGAFDHWKFWGIVKLGCRMQVAIVFGIYEVLLKNCNSVTTGEVD